MRYYTICSLGVALKQGGINMNHEEITIGDIILGIFTFIGIVAVLYVIASACGLYG